MHATSVLWGRGFMLYNLSYTRMLLESLFAPTVWFCLSDMLYFYFTKHQSTSGKKLLDYLNRYALGFTLVFLVWIFFELNSLASNNNLVLFRTSGIMAYSKSQTVWSAYFWEAIWVSVCIVTCGLLRVFVDCFGVLASLTLYLGSVVLGVSIPFGLKLYILVFLKSLLIYSLLNTQQKLARRDINDRGYEFHQVQFNTILRRIPS